MSTSPANDPIERLSRIERRAWRTTERQARKDHDSEQMAALASMAASGGGVTGVSSPDAPIAGLGTPVEMIIAGRRLRAARVHRRALAALKEALGSLAAIPLTAVGRYGPYWVLTFKLATEQIVVLADHLVLLPEWGGPGGRGQLPTGPLASLAG